MLSEFSGKRVLVVGAARGIGRVIAEFFAERGAQVWACDVLVDEVEKYIGPASGSERIIYAVKVDVADTESVKLAVGRAQGENDSVDVLVYAAGGVRGQVAAPIETVTVGAWQDIVEANLTGFFLFVRAVAFGMKRSKQGRIVAISSRAGLASSLTGIQSYAAAKHGQIGLVRQLAEEFGPFGVTVNAVAPGFMLTSPDYERQWNMYTNEFRVDFLNRIAMRRMGRAEDVAHAVLFLASERASWITGQVLPVTGGPVG
jgi:3-oxoacyl-[acyl-carrier protein] reductase